MTRLAAGMLLAAASLLASAANPGGAKTATRTGDTTICLMRHPDTARGADGLYVDRFTPAGEAQIAALPAKLDAVTPRFDAILTSPAWRAMHGVLPYLRDRGQVAEVLPELAESSWQSSPESRPVAGPPLTLRGELARHFRWVKPGYGSVLGRGVIPYAPGTAAATELITVGNRYLRQRFAHSGATVLLVGHYHTGARLMAALQGGGFRDYDPRAAPYQLENGALSCLRQGPGEPDFRLVSYNDRPRGE